jgi:hypothetical protein
MYMKVQTGELSFEIIASKAVNLCFSSPIVWIPRQEGHFQKATKFGKILLRNLQCPYLPGHTASRGTTKKVVLRTATGTTSWQTVWAGTWFRSAVQRRQMKASGNVWPRAAWVRGESRHATCPWRVSNVVLQSVNYKFCSSCRGVFRMYNKWGSQGHKG